MLTVSIPPPSLSPHSIVGHSGQPVDDIKKYIDPSKSTPPFLIIIGITTPG